MKEFLWHVLAFIVSRKPIANYLIRRSKKTPYYNIPGYMDRDWIFNPYGKDENGDVIDARWPFLPSIRVHHILRRDYDRHRHDHPWNARTIVLRDWYYEERLEKDGTVVPYLRSRGETATLKFGEFHRITVVPLDGVWTLFFTWRYQGTWGFLVDGVKIPWKEYKKMYPERF